MRCDGETRLDFFHRNAPRLDVRRRNQEWTTNVKLGSALARMGKLAGVICIRAVARIPSWQHQLVTTRSRLFSVPSISKPYRTLPLATSTKRCEVACPPRFTTV